jgi:CheY-like chemotaxis protein
VTARVAVIDDEAPNRAYLQTLLGTAGFDVQVASGGNEGVALVEKERPDLVLVDLMEVAAMILYQRDEFSAASKRRVPIVIHHPQAQATTQFNELMQALAAV